MAQQRQSTAASTARSTKKMKKEVHGIARRRKAGARHREPKAGSTQNQRKARSRKRARPAPKGKRAITVAERRPRTQRRAGPSAHGKIRKVQASMRAVVKNLRAHQAVQAARQSQEAKGRPRARKTGRAGQSQSGYEEGPPARAGSHQKTKEATTSPPARKRQPQKRVRPTRVRPTKGWQGHKTARAPARGRPKKERRRRGGSPRK